MKPFKILTIISFICVLTTSCTALKPYERIYVNDPEMQMGSSGSGAFENYVNTIREGSMSAESQKGSGGCGCN